VSTDKIYVDDVGTVITVDCGSDLEGATEAVLLVRKPDGIEVSWPATIIAIDGVKRFLRYVTHAGELDQPGTYKVQAKVLVPGWSGRVGRFRSRSTRILQIIVGIVMALSDRVQYRTYRISLTEPLLGSLPSSKLIYQEYIARKAPEPEAEGADEMAMLPAETPKTTVFLRDDQGGCCLMDYQFVGFLKSAANVLKDIVEVPVRTEGKPRKKTGIPALRNKLQRFVFVDPRVIRLGRAPDGIYERPLQAMSRVGPRTCLASSEVLNPPISFEIQIGLLPNAEITWVCPDATYGVWAIVGLGQFRGAGYGRFTFDLL
jgi:hypothetical protein